MTLTLQPKAGSDIRDTLFAIARDGARPHIASGIVKRLRAVASQIQDHAPHDPMARSWAAQIEAEIANIESLT